MSICSVIVNIGSVMQLDPPVTKPPLTTSKPAL
jgi:hypothetical protein